MKALILLTALSLIVPLVPILGAEEDPPRALELVGEAPDWWTPEAARAATDAGQEGLLYNPVTKARVNPAMAPAGGLPVAPDYLFIRPGALFLGESGALCTYNFIYGAGTQIGTAGHCVERRGETVFILAAPTVPLVAALGKVGSFKNAGVGNDYALINIDAAWHDFVDPHMAYLSGPSCPTWTPSLEAGKHVGHGFMTGLVASVPRTSLITTTDGRAFQAAGQISGGDSGSPIVEAEGGTACALGGAIGVITHCLSVTGIECLPIFFGTDIRRIAATVTTGLDPL